MIGDWIEGLVVDGPLPPRRAAAYRIVLAAAAAAFAALAILDTVPALWARHHAAIHAAEAMALVILAGDYGLRLWVAGTAGGDTLRRYALGAYGIFDFLAVVPFLLGAAAGLPRDAETVSGILCLLKLARYSPALETLGVVVLAEFRPLMSALFIMILLAVFTATLLYFAERDVNPSLATVPHALWWSVVTLATLGYGDVVPVTALGKVLGAGVAVLGLCMFALPASILASGFNEEMRRRSFVSTWHLVSKVPFFSGLDASRIAEIAALLKSYRAVTGEVIVREGDLGESMYFIVSGQMEVRGRGGVFILKAGEFFGEIALIDQCPRTATVKALTRCQLLILDARDFSRFVADTPGLLATITATARQRLRTDDHHTEDA